MEIRGALAAGPPGGIPGLGQAGGTQAASLNRFFALIQSIFQARSESLPEGRRPDRGDFHAPEGRADLSRREAVGARPRADRARPAGRADAAAHKPADSRRDEVQAPPAEGLDGGTPQEGVSDPGRAREPAGLGAVVEKLRDLAARIQEGMAPVAAFLELLKLLAVFSHELRKLPEGELAVFFERLAPAFDLAIDEIRQILDKTDGAKTALLKVLFAESAGHEAKGGPRQLEELVRSLVSVLEEAARPKPAVEPGSAVQEAADPKSGVSAAPATPAKASHQEGTHQAVAQGETPQAAGPVREGAHRQENAHREGEGARQFAQVRLEASGEGTAAPLVQAPVQGASPEAAGPEGEKLAPVGLERTGSAARVLAKEPMRLGERMLERLEQIVRMAKLSASEGGRRLQIRLYPPHLGHVRMDLSVRDGSLVGTFRVETAAARAAVLSQIQDLKAALAEEGVSVGSFQVSVEGQEKPAPFDDEGRDRPGRPQAQTRQEPEAASALAGTEEAAPRLSYVDVRG